MSKYIVQISFKLLKNWQMATICFNIPVYTSKKKQNFIYFLVLQFFPGTRKAINIYRWEKTRMKKMYIEELKGGY